MVQEIHSAISKIKLLVRNNSVPIYSVLPLHYECITKLIVRIYIFFRTNVENDLHTFVLERKNIRSVLCVQNMSTCPRNTTRWRLRVCVEIKPGMLRAACSFDVCV